MSTLLRLGVGTGEKPSRNPYIRPKLSRLLGLSPRELSEILNPDVYVTYPTPIASRRVPERLVPREKTGVVVEAITPYDTHHNPSPDGYSITSLRHIVDSYDLPDDGPVRSLTELREAVTRTVGFRLNSDYRRLVERLPVLLPELTRALFLRRDAEREEVARMLVQSYRAADAVADKLGFYDLSARIIQVMRWAAEQSGDELALAATSYVRTETFFANGQLETGRLMLEQAVDRLRPGASAPAAAAYGSLHMRAAVVAARAGLPDRAAEHLAEARSAAAGVVEGVYQGTAFGPASVRVHEVTLTLDLGNPDKALAVAAGWAPPDQLPAERRSHFHVDIARALLLTGHENSVLAALDEARNAAPEHIRIHPQVRDVLKSMPRGGDTENGVRKFIAAAGIASADHLLA